MSDRLPDAADRGTRWFDCAYCDSTFTDDDLNNIRKRAAKHLNRDHGDQLSHHLDPVETEEYIGDHIHENIYHVKRVTIYLTPFDILSPIRVDGYLTPSDNDKVCDNCGARVTHDGDLEKVELEPDSILNDDWKCSACVKKAKLQQKMDENNQLTDYTA